MAKILVVDDEEHIRQLVTLYLEKEERLRDRAQAFAHALHLKPACTDYRAEAEHLLEQLEL